MMEITYSKNRFAQALRELLNQKPLKQITVSELTEKAGLSRQTFYQLFSDKYDLVSYFWAKEVEKAKVQSEESESLAEVWVRRLKAIQEDKVVYKSLLEYMDEQNAFFYSWVDISLTTPSIMSDLMKSSPDLVFAAKVYSYGTGMCVRDWVLGGCKQAPEGLMRQMILSFPGILMPYIILGETDYLHV